MLARLLGLRLLRLEADIAVVPAAYDSRRRGNLSGRAVARARSADLSDAEQLLARASRTLADVPDGVRAVNDEFGLPDAAEPPTWRRWTRTANGSTPRPPS